MIDATVEGGLAASEDAFPWPPDGRPVLEALGQTWRQCIFEPARFFGAMPRAGPILPAVAFYLILAWASAGIDLFWRMALPQPAWFEGVLPASQTPLLDFLLTGPVALAMTAVFAGLVHLTLMVLGARREPAGATLRVLLYGSGAPALFQLVPWVGLLIGLVAGLMVSTVGLRTVHTTTTGRALAALLGPVVGVMTLVMAVVILVTVVAVSLGLVAR